MNRNARFWIWYKDDVVKITMKEGDIIHFYNGGPNDEGYYYEHESYEHIGDHVNRVIDSMAMDCDGRLDRHYSYSCDLEYLNFEWNDYNNLYMPCWIKDNSYQRDYEAEKAGY